MSDVITEGEVGPELEQYVNALLDRIRELEAENENLKARNSEMFAQLNRRDLEIQDLRARELASRY